MSRYSVIPSLFQVNEGDSITTAVTTDLSVGSRLYYKVVGTKVTAGDFTSGGISGSVKVGAGGVASILHKLKADKATEGEESFTIQIFSDKKMKMLVGESDVVRVADTSVKPVKTTSSGGSVDSITGQVIKFDGVEIVSDKLYGDGSQIQSLLGYDKIVESAVTNFSLEFEFGTPNFIVYNLRYTSSDQIGYSWTTTQRFVWEGLFRYNNRNLVSAYLKRVSDDTYSVRSDGLVDQGGSVSLPLADGNGINISDPSSLSSWGAVISPIASVPYPQQERQFKYSTHSGDETGFRGYQDGKFFAEGWWTNPFQPNLI